MINLTFDAQTLNAEALHAELKTALGESFVGLSVSNKGVVIHLEESPEGAEDTIRAVIGKHKPEALTPGQQKRAEKANRLEVLRAKSWQQLSNQDKDDLLCLVAELLGLVGGE